MVLNDFAGIQNLWMVGVADGHGAHGHLVSNYVKINLPKILGEMITSNKINEDDYLSSPGSKPRGGSIINKK